MAAGDFTTLNNVKSWRSPALTSEIVDDKQLSREITAASTAIRNYLQRDMVPQNYTEARNGNGQSALMLYQYPVVSISSVVVDTVSIPVPTNANSFGFVYDAKKGLLYLRGYVFSPGFQNVVISYTAGYQAPMTLEGRTIPAYVGNVDDNSKVQCSSLPNLWNSDAGVTYTSSGTALTSVSNSPAPGQYVPPLDPGGYYLFNVADIGTSVTVGYGFTPPDVEEACVQLVILEYNRRGRIGENTKALAGENVAYYNSAAFTPTIKDRLNPYKQVVPIND